MQPTPTPIAQEAGSVKFRVVVVPLIQNGLGEYLICRMPKDRGVFPSQWGLPGGGIEDGERMFSSKQHIAKCLLADPEG
ncbi:MAG: NUDIX domain-containing protein [Pyrinomonadaceae bacterium]